MNCTDHPTTSQLQPNSGVVQPAPCAAPFVGRPADAANDPDMSSGAYGKSALLNKARERMAAVESGQSSKYSQRSIAGFRDRLTWAAEHVQATTTERGAK